MSSIKMFQSLRQLPTTLRRYLSTSTSPLTSPESALRLLKSQPSHYIIAQLHLRRYLLTPNDILTVPRISSLNVGDTIQLSRILEVGSRDYTLRPPAAEKGQEPKVLNNVQVMATVIEHTKSKMQFIEKFKRRQRYSRRLMHKGQWCVSDGFFLLAYVLMVATGRGSGLARFRSRMGRRM